MSFTITLFGPNHYWWKTADWKTVSRVWFMRPDEHSTGEKPSAPASGSPAPESSAGSGDGIRL